MVDGLNLSSGIGRGEAQILDTSGSVNYYLNEAKRREQQQLAEQKALQADLSKVSMDGIREADRPEYVQKYNEWKTLQNDVNKARTNADKAQAKLNFDKKYLELQELVSDSKGLAKGETAFTNILLDPTKRDGYADDSVSRFQKSKTLSRTDPNFVRDLTQYERKWDLSKVDDKLRTLDSHLLSNQQESNPATGSRLKVGNRTGTNLVYKTSVDPAKQVEAYATMYKADPDFRQFLKQTYPDLYANNDPISATSQALTDLASKRPIQKQRNQLVLDEKEDNWKEKAIFMAALRAATKKEGDEVTIYRQKQIDDVWSQRNSASGAGNAVERLKAVVEANPMFDGANVNTMIRDTGRWINVSVPERKVSYTTTDPEGNEILRYRKQDPYKVTIDKRNPNDKLKLNRVFDALTGEKVSDSKLQTGRPSGKVSGTIYTEQNKQLPKSVTSKFKNVPKGGF